MKKVLHLHAGFHKTGTTAIQEYLFNADLDPEYTYFHTGIANSSLIMLQAFKQDLFDDPQFRKDVTLLQKILLEYESVPERDWLRDLAKLYKLTRYCPPRLYALLRQLSAPICMIF